MQRFPVLSASFVLALSVSGAFAGIEQAPPSFPYRDGKAVFVDFRRADYRIVYDLAAKTAIVDTEIAFDAPESGYPIFDLIPEPKDVRLDDRETTASVTADPSRASRFRVLQEIVAPGSHRLTLSHRIATNVSFRADGVASAFWMSDLNDRRYLEQYLPTNFEFDQYPTSIRVEIAGAAGKPHVLRANGAVKALAENVFQVDFPDFYTTSSMFFHLSPKDAIRSSRFAYKSVDGRDLPVEVYSNGDLPRYVAEVKRVLAELEGDYGRFPHAQVIVYGAGRGGMEYSGATVSSLGAVGHELFHSYNARGVMPAQGNAGWMDEAMSSWRDRKYARRASPGSATRMAGHSVWTRKTDAAAYGAGADFLAWMAGRLASAGKDLKVFLRGYLTENFSRTMTTDLLKAALESYSGFDLKADFERYVYGKGSKTSPRGSIWPPAPPANALSASGGSDPAPETAAENPYHPRLTKEELESLL